MAYQEGLHVLSDADANRERDSALRVIRDSDSGNLSEIGVAIHPLGDSFSHRKLSDESKTYSPFFGHLEDGVDPDVIHNRKDLYFGYVETLAIALSEKTGAKMTKEVSWSSTNFWGQSKLEIPKSRIVMIVNAQSRRRLFLNTIPIPGL